MTETDEFGNYVIPKNCTTIAPPDNPSLYKPRFDPAKEEWFEFATQEYIDGLQPVVEPSDLEIVRQRQAEIVFILMMKGVL
nr:hypothetical protein [Bacillus safensis]